MDDYSEPAMFAEFAFIALMSANGIKTSPTPPEHFVSLLVDEMADEQLDRLEHVLTRLAAQYGYKYEAPTLFDESKKLIIEEPLKFVKRYVEQLKRMEMDPFSISFI